MADPQSSNIGMNLPTRGSDVGVWDTSVNGNTNALDGLFGGVLSLTLTAAATTTLTLPAGFTPTPSAGPVQSQNAIIKLSGTLTGNNVLVCTRPGFFIVYNNCTVGSFVVTMSNGAGSTIGLPPGALWHVFNDGTNYYHCNLPLVGALEHLTGFTTTPAWITASTLPPFLLCDGSVFNISAYPNLGAQLGSTFGGNGSTTFGTPDLRGRLPIAYDGTGTRITASGAGFNGQTLGASGGSQNQTLAAGHIPLLTTGGQSATHTHNVPNTIGGAGSGVLTGGGLIVTSEASGNANGDHTHTTGNVSPAGFTTVMPSQVTGIWLVRAA